MTFLEETIICLKKNNKSFDDVVYIGSEEIRISIDNFKRIADIVYDGGFGAAEIATDLIIIGDDFWMTRGEYDGSEWWDFHKKPNIPESEIIELDYVCVSQNPNSSCGWESLAKMNNVKETK